ncbi:hypothetical protein D3C72_887830 [compost metagenome]
MRFQVGGLEGHESITGRVRFIEGVLCKGFPVGPDLIQLIGRHTFGNGTINKFAFHLIQRSTVFLTHRLTQYIGIPFRETAQFLRQQHHLLLVYGNTVGLGQVFFHFRKVIRDLFLSVFTLNKVRDILQRARTIQGIHRNKVTKFIRFQIDEVLLHTRTLKLECRIGIASLVQLVGQFIIERNGININFYTVIHFDQLQGITDNRQGLQTQEVHFDYTGILNDFTFILGDQ